MVTVEMLYRRYRPQKFAELVGLSTVKNTLLAQVKDGKVAHAYLFAGPRGTGKTTTARILAKAVDCADCKAGEPCAVCQVCKQVEEGRYLDLIEIDAASNRGIDDIRALREKVRLVPSVGEHKVYIIDEAHMLTTEAFNALLKTLEEPPKHAIFILCTTEAYKLPETIRSRCQRFNFERASVGLIVDRLLKICREEGAELARGELEEIAKASGGGFRDAETLLEQVISGGQKVADLVGSASLENLEEFFDLLIAGKAGPALIFINDLNDKGVGMERFNEKVLEYLRDLLLMKAGVGESLVDVGQERFTKMQGQALSLAPDQLSKMIEKFTQSYENLTQSSIPTLPLEVAVVEVASHEARSRKPDARENPAGKTLRVEGAQTRRVEECGVEEPACAEASFVAKAMEDRSAGRSAAPGGDKWSLLLNRVKPLNHSIAALLRSCEPGEVEGRKFVIRALYPFHKERLETSKNRAILEEVIEQVYGRPLKLEVKLARGR